MLKMVKVKKQLRLDELIEYAFDNDVKDIRFNSSNGAVIYFDRQGGFTLADIFSIKKTSTFTVEVEEEITEDTKFMWLVEAGDERIWNQRNASIGDVIDERTNEIRALINGKLQLIWERGRDEL